MSNQITCFTIFRYESPNKKWALKQMFRSREILNGWKNLRFYKLVGLGGGKGYSIRTNFDAYGIITIWDNPEYAHTFFKSPFFNEFQSKSKEHFTIFMKPVKSRGSWSGFRDFEISEMDPDNNLICVLTRATLRTKFIYRFFRLISGVMKDHDSFQGLLFSKGFSEIPFREQATFSVWENINQMNKFAYNSFHAIAIRITRKKRGFSEEMYTRFQPFATIGTWYGHNPFINKIVNYSNYDFLNTALAS